MNKQRQADAYPRGYSQLWRKDSNCEFIPSHWTSILPSLPMIWFSRSEIPITGHFLYSYRLKGKLPLQREKALSSHSLKKCSLQIWFARIFTHGLLGTQKSSLWHFKLKTKKLRNVSKEQSACETAKILKGFLYSGQIHWCKLENNFILKFII